MAPGMWHRGILIFMVIRTDIRLGVALTLCIGTVISTGCGTSTQASRYQMQHGVSESGYPPTGGGTDYGSPSISSMGGDVDEKGIEAEPVKAPKQNIPANLAASPRT